VAAKDERDDGSLHVLVDAGKRCRRDLKPGLFFDFAGQARVNVLVGFEDSAGGFPAAVVGALDDEESPLVVGDRGGDADRVQCRWGFVRR
jgi:hypothetical protein